MADAVSDPMQAEENKRQQEEQSQAPAVKASQGVGTTVTNVTSKANAPSKTKANNTASSKSSSSSYSSILNATGNASNAPSDVPPRPTPTSKNSSASKDDTDYDALLGIPSIQDEAKAVFLEKMVDTLAQSQGSQATSSSMNAQATSKAATWNPPSQKQSLWQSFLNAEKIEGMHDVMSDLGESSRLTGIKAINPQDYSDDLQASYNLGYQTALGEQGAASTLLSLAPIGKLTQFAGKFRGFWKGAQTLKNEVSTVEKTTNEIVASSAGKFDKEIEMFKNYLGKDMKVYKPVGARKSDLILESADRTKRIRFDIINSHGDEPHVNVELLKPRNLFSGDDKMIPVENIHVYPQNNLEDQDLFTSNNGPNL